ncbi:hypothetical protein [Mesonia aquimarina]|uniref:hypothetical protein n=1 Tax=Mesonia aquimarina TaxID=1504967 RepID=UPI000EF5F176|nr:hypothetical protein [Mesonia aquimarina]
MTTKFLQILIVFYSLSCFGQQITYKHIVDSSAVETNEVMHVFESYIASNPQEKNYSEYWNKEVQTNYVDVDFLASEFQPSLYMGYPIHVLSISSMNGLYQIKAQFSFCKADGTPFVLAIVNYFAKKENGEFKLYNALHVNKQHWKCKTNGMINFYFPGYHDFDFKKAEKLNAFVQRICKNLEVNPTPFDYYFADHFDEVQKLKGIDYYVGMGGESMPSGKASEGKVYCSGLGEYYPHEVFHVQIDEHYPNKHFWVSEGMATFLGGSRGKDLEWHLIKTNAYLKRNPAINLNNLLELDNLDNATAYHYALGGLLVKKVYEKGGWEALKKFMRSGTADSDYYKAIEEQLGIKQTALNAYLRNELEAY